MTSDETQRKIREHHARWADLEWVGGRSEVPEHDGDLSLLFELRDRIDTELATYPGDPFEVVNWLEINTGSIDYITQLDNDLLGWRGWTWPDRLDRGLIAEWREGKQAA